VAFHAKPFSRPRKKSFVVSRGEQRAVDAAAGILKSRSGSWVGKFFRAENFTRAAFSS
jgi:hypothetical protein